MEILLVICSLMCLKKLLSDNLEDTCKCFRKDKKDQKAPVLEHMQSANMTDALRLI